MKEKNINSLIIALFLSANPIAWIIPNSEAPLFIVILSCWALLILNRQLIKVLNSHFIVNISVGIILLMFLFGFIFADSEALKQYFISFIGFGISGIYFSQLNFSVKSVFKYISIISIPLVFFIYRMDLGAGIDGRIDYSKWMGVSYGIVRFVVALLTMILFYRRSKTNLVLHLIILFFYLWFFAEYGSRGAVLAILFFLISYPVTKNMSIKRKRIIISSLGISMIILLFAFIPILNTLNNILIDNNIEVLAINKILRLHEVGNIDNGRTALFKNGLDGFINNPFFGNSIGSFEKDNFGYVHNFIVQILYEGGILFFIPIIYILIQSIKIIYVREADREMKLFMLFLMTAGLIELLFSSSYWRSVFFWFYVFYVFKSINVTQQNNYV